MSDKTETSPAEPEGPWVAHALNPGHDILEYEVERTLGGGGFGITYLARDKNLNLPVAVKEYLPTDLAMRGPDGSVQVLGDTSKDQFIWGLERFLSEARVLAAFCHPNIVRVLRYFLANGTAYIVMEFETGESLKKWLPRQNKLDQPTLLKMIYPLLDGLEVIHKAGYLHRDIKPENIYIRTNNTPVLIDFGSARSTDNDGEMTSIVSPGFAPLEQYQSKGNQGPWTDIYSLAGVMYWWLSGQKPMNSIERLKNDSMVPAAQLDCHNLMSKTLLAAIDWALNSDEAKRPQSVAEFRKRLQESTGQESNVASSEMSTAVSSRWEATAVSGTSISAPEGQGSILVCSILFLDIIEYSKTSVNEQYQLKSIFNQLIASELAHIPVDSRITLDTGDGAAICFMGDPEEVLYASKNIQRKLAQQDRLQVRMGLHIGPVRILNDLNGYNNVIGDGINVAQRVMSFSSNNSLVVSRAFFEIVACITDGGERSFSYIGERRDKHDRAHEIYAVLSDAEYDKNADRTIVVNAKTSPVHSFEPEVIANMEKELAQHLGPLAPVLMRKVKARATSETELRNLLAQSISDPIQRESFIQGPHAHSWGSNNSSSRANNTISRKLANSGPPSSQSGSNPSAFAITIPVWVTPEAASSLEKLLAKSIGPLARVLVKNESRKTEDFFKLCQALSLHIDNPDSRSRFIKDTSSLRIVKR